MKTTDWTKLERLTHKDGSPLNLDPQVGADERGQQVVLPGPRDVFLDIDSDEAFQYMHDRLTDMGKLGGAPGQLVLVSAEPSKSGLPKRHVILRAPHDLSDEERIALQAVLGSDLIREFLSLMRKWSGGEIATTFYENLDWKDPR